jgi:hypothetical protein
LASASIVPAAVSVTELGYIDGVTSAIQTQMDTKAATAATINPTIVDAKGDLIAATAADAVSRLAVGANDTILTADSTAATGLKWAAAGGSGLNLISTTTLSASSSFNIVDCFSATYDDYIIEVDEIVGSTASYWNYGLRTGSTNAVANYKYVSYQFTYAGSNQSGTGTSNVDIGSLNWTTTAADAGGLSIRIKAPFIAKATQHFTLKSQNDAGASVQGLHAVATSFNSLWFIVNSGTVSGKIRIYGLAK